MATVYSDNLPELTPEEIALELEEAKKKPIEYDEDCPELSSSMLKQLKVAARNRDRIIMNNQIFKVLKEKGITQKQLSKMTGIPESTISEWKNKGKVPGIDKILLISEALGVSPNTLLKDGTSDNDVESIIHMVDALSKSDKKYLLSYLQGILTINNN